MRTIFDYAPGFGLGLSGLPGLPSPACLVPLCGGLATSACILLADSLIGSPARSSLLISVHSGAGISLHDCGPNAS